VHAHRRVSPGWRSVSFGMQSYWSCRSRKVLPRHRMTFWNVLKVLEEGWWRLLSHLARVTTYLNMHIVVPCWVAHSYLEQCIPYSAQTLSCYLRGHCGYAISLTSIHAPHRNTQASRSACLCSIPFQDRFSTWTASYSPSFAMACHFPSTCRWSTFYRRSPSRQWRLCC